MQMIIAIEGKKQGETMHQTDNEYFFLTKGRKYEVIDDGGKWGEPVIVDDTGIKLSIPRSQFKKLFKYE